LNVLKIKKLQEQKKCSDFHKQLHFRFSNMYRLTKTSILLSIPALLPNSIIRACACGLVGLDTRWCSCKESVYTSQVYLASGLCRFLPCGIWVACCRLVGQRRTRHKLADRLTGFCLPMGSSWAGNRSYQTPMSADFIQRKSPSPWERIIAVTFQSTSAAMRRGQDFLYLFQKHLTT